MPPMDRRCNRGRGILLLRLFAGEPLTQFVPVVRCSGYVLLAAATVWISRGGSFAAGDHRAPGCASTLTNASNESCDARW